MHRLRNFSIPLIALTLVGVAFAVPRKPKIATALTCDVPTSRPSSGDPKLRQSAHKGLAYLTESSKQWTAQHGCFGCHVQAVTMEALATGVHHRYDVGTQDIDAMVRALELGPTAGGHVTGVAFEGAAWARYDNWIGNGHTKELLHYAEELLTLQQPNGAVVDDDARRPITGGTMQTTYQAAQTWRQAFARTADEKWLRPLRRAEGFLFETAGSWTEKEPPYIQDVNFALLGLVASGAGRSEGPSQKLQTMLLARQNKDGGFGLDGPSDAFATGQTLYTLKQAGYADSEPPIARGLAYLLKTQESSGAWKTYRSGQGGAEKGETMWAVLGLATIDVASMTVSGLVDGQHLPNEVPVQVSAIDNLGGGIGKIEIRLDDLPVQTACGDKLTHTLDATRLSSGKHVVEVVAFNQQGLESQRRFEVYAGDVFMTHVAADFDEVRQKTLVSLRNIAPIPGRVQLEVLSVDASGAPSKAVFSTEQTASTGPMAFEWAGTGNDGKTLPRGRFMAKLSYLDGTGKTRQQESALFLHDTRAEQQKDYGEVEGRVSLKQGAASASNTVIELVDDDGNVVQTTRTTEQGNYRFKNINAGKYKVRTRKDGFQQLEASVEAKKDSAPASVSMTW